MFVGHQQSYNNNAGKPQPYPACLARISKLDERINRRTITGRKEAQSGIFRSFYFNQQRSRCHQEKFSGYNPSHLGERLLTLGKMLIFLVKHKVKRTSQIWMKSTIFDFSSKWVMSKIIARACHLVLLFPASSSSKWGEFHLVPALSSRWRQYTVRQQCSCTFLDADILAALPTVLVLGISL